MYIYLCMWKEPNIDIYACNISSVHIYKYNKLKYTNLSIQNWTRFTSCSPKRPFKCRLARLMLFISVPFRPFRPFFDRLNGQPFNFRLPPKQNSLPPFTVYWPFKRPFNPFRRTLDQTHVVNADIKWENGKVDSCIIRIWLEVWIG